MRPTLKELENPTELLHPSITPAQVTADVLAPIYRAPHPLWWVGLLAAVGLACFAMGTFAVQMSEGIGILGINQTVGWGSYITNFVFWVGIGHAGTLISAILFLFRQRWRTSINRSAEAMTIFAVSCAGIFPLMHTGRPWVDFWLFPLSQQPFTMATVSFSADVGRVCHFDLCNDLVVVLVPRFDPRLRHHS